jgi:hypothetical protein
MPPEIPIKPMIMNVGGWKITLQEKDIIRLLLNLTLNYVSFYCVERDIDVFEYQFKCVLHS